MKALFIICLIAFAGFATAEVFPGIIEKVYSSKGLVDHYKSIIKDSVSTFDNEDMGTETDSTGVWVFGSAMTIKNTYLDDFNFGSINKVNYANNEYNFGVNKFEGILHYTWTHNIFVAPFSNKNTCKFIVEPYNLKIKFGFDNDKLAVTRDIQYTTPPKLACEDAEISDKTHYLWMVDVRNKYEEKLGESFKKAIDSWLNTVDTVFATSLEADLDDLNFKLKSHLKDVSSDNVGNLVVGYNYDISLLKKKRSPEPTVERTALQSQGDLTTYFFQDFFQSLIELDKESVSFWAAVNHANLPDGSTFGMTAKDFRYIIDGIGKYDPSTSVDVGCEYGDENPEVLFDTDGVTLVMPITCVLRVGVNKSLLASFTLNVDGKPMIDKEGTMTVANLEYSVGNFTSENKIGGKVLDTYLINRIIEYMYLEDPLGGLSYNDGRFNGLTGLRVDTGKQWMRVTAEIPD